MSVVLHMRKNGRISPLVVGGDQFRRRVVYDVIRDGRTVATFDPAHVAAYSTFSTLEDAKREADRIDAMLEQLRQDIEAGRCEELRQMDRLKRKKARERMIGRAS